MGFVCPRCVDNTVHIGQGVMISPDVHRVGTEAATTAVAALGSACACFSRRRAVTALAPALGGTCAPHPDQHVLCTLYLPMVARNETTCLYSSIPSNMSTHEVSLHGAMAPNSGLTSTSACGERRLELEPPGQRVCGGDMSSVPAEADLLLVARDFWLRVPPAAYAPRMLDHCLFMNAQGPPKKWRCGWTQAKKNKMRIIVMRHTPLRRVGTSLCVCSTQRKPDGLEHKFIPFVKKQHPQQCNIWRGRPWAPSKENGSHRVSQPPGKRRRC